MSRRIIWVMLKNKQKGKKEKEALKFKCLILSDILG